MNLKRKKYKILEGLRRNLEFITYQNRPNNFKRKNLHKNLHTLKVNETELTKTKKK